MPAFWSMRLYLPRWSAEIIDETVRTLENELGLKPEQTAHLIEELRNHFGDAWVEEYESLIPIMENDSKDRHVLAAAVRTGAQTIVTFNLKHFREEHLAKWNLIAQHPDDFVIHQYYLDPSNVIDKLRQQAAERHSGDLERLLSIHEKTIPKLTTLLRKEL